MTTTTSTQLRTDVPPSSYDTMIVFEDVEQSDAMHEQLRDLECRLFDGLGIP